MVTDTSTDAHGWVAGSQSYEEAREYGATGLAPAAVDADKKVNFSFDVIDCFCFSFDVITFIEKLSSGMVSALAKQKSLFVSVIFAFIADFYSWKS